MTDELEKIARKLYYELTTTYTEDECEQEARDIDIKQITEALQTERKKAEDWKKIAERMKESLEELIDWEVSPKIKQIFIDYNEMRGR